MQTFPTEKEKIIQKIQNYFSTTNVRRISLFGSFARNQANANSDIDLLLELDEPVGYLTIIGYKLALEDYLQCKVDLLTPDSISPKIHPYIQKDLKLIYECTR